MDISDLAQSSGEWLRGGGPESDIVISSRIRLARNLAEYPFVNQAGPAERHEIESTLEQAITGIRKPKLEYFSVDDFSSLDRQFLVERQLISREHAEGEGARGVAIDASERISLMVNEEDHLRIQVMHSGLDLDAAWKEIDKIDNEIERHVTYAFDQRLGYLTACPTNAGTGMRVSVMLHLPAVALTEQVEKIFRSLQKINVAVRGLYGEGSQPAGDFYQISNQITLGRDEANLIGTVADVVPTIIQYERKARAYLQEEKREVLHDRISRAYGILRNAQTITSEETMHYLSRVRMGINMGLIKDLQIPTVNELFIYTQPAHLQKMSGSEMNSANRNIERARYLRDNLNGGEAPSGNGGDLI
ncbi:MAG: protein arginine kinase [Pirellulales bacterium]|nr:protein arginine kinase [Pirellulales bacterium]